MKSLIFIVWSCVVQVSGATQFNPSHDSCVPASFPSSQKQIRKFCHPYQSKQRGYCKDVIGDWLVKKNPEDQRLLEIDLSRIEITVRRFQRLFNIEISRQCVLAFNNVFCRWSFPKCDTSTANLTVQSICKESCEYVYRMCEAELKFTAPFTAQSHRMNCSDMKLTNGGESPECYHPRFLNTETDKLHATECYYGNGFGYRGNVSLTRSGHQCQSWSSQCPHRHDHSLSQYPELVNSYNWCRNPGGQGPNGPWCYTTNSSIRWENCDVEKCPPPAPSIAPTILQVSSRGPNKVFLAWSPFPLPFVHGMLRGFRIFATKMDSSHAKQMVKTIGPTANSIELNNLEPLTNYSLSLLAFNENGDGPSSRAVSVETMPKNFISVRYILTLNQQKFNDHLLNNTSRRYRKLASRVTRKVSRILQKTKTKGYRFYKIEISKFMYGSVLVEFYVIAEVLRVLPKWSIVQDITGRMVKRSSSRSSKSDKMDFSSLLVEDMPPPPVNITAQGDVTMTSVRVYWSPPHYHEPYRITNYTVQYKKANTKMLYYDAVNVNSNKTKVVVDNLDLDSKYLMRVLSVNAYGSSPSQPILVKTNGKSSSNTLLVIALTLSTVVIGVTSLIVGVAYRRWSKKRDYLAQFNSTNLFEALGIEITKDWWEIPRDDLLIEEKLGSGSFGVVKRAYLNTREQENERTLCAVKMLKDNPTERELRDLCNEINLMTAVGDHPNIISLIGACTKNGPPWLVVKYAVNGCLLDYLKENRTLPTYSNIESLDNRAETITPLMKLSFAYDIAQGMSHLEKNRVVHRDLAAKNILLGRNMVAMVSDFGFSRDVYEMGFYENTEGGILPVRWMSLESLENYTYTTESDVWSYGVVLWEIENEGQMPYAGMFNGQQILEYLRQGYRLNNQENTSRDIQVIMRDCWNQDPKQRPTFSSLVDKLNDLYQRQAEPQDEREQDDGYLSEIQDLDYGQISLQGDNTSYHENQKMELTGCACGGNTEVRFQDNAEYDADDPAEENNATPQSTKDSVTITTSNDTSSYFV